MWAFDGFVLSLFSCLPPLSPKRHGFCGFRVLGFKVWGLGGFRLLMRGYKAFQGLYSDTKGSITVYIPGAAKTNMKGLTRKGFLSYEAKVEGFRALGLFSFARERFSFRGFTRCCKGFGGLAGEADPTTTDSNKDTTKSYKPLHLPWSPEPRTARTRALRIPAPAPNFVEGMLILRPRQLPLRKSK